MKSFIDFTDCFCFKTNDYKGQDHKEKILFNNEFYMLKFQNHTKSKSPLVSEYSNNIFSEYISCHIIETIGLPVQETLLGTYKGQYVVACKDFTSDEYKLSEFSSFENSFNASTKLGKHPPLERVLNLYDDYLAEFKDCKLKEMFWDIFIVDALLANFDRHAGNWGFLVNQKTGMHIPAPIYDCGSCLFPQPGEYGLNEILKNSDAINERVYVFPRSSITFEGEKINYFSFISSNKNEDCTAALKRILPKINLNKIKDVIDSTPGISDVRKEFYFKMISERKEKILDYSLHKIQSVENNLDSKIGNAKKRSDLFNAEVSDCINIEKFSGLDK